MSAQKYYEQTVLPIAKYWLKELEFYGENQFRKVTESSPWTIGQVYQHVSEDVLHSNAKILENVLQGKHESVGGKNLKGWLVFSFSNFLWFKFKSEENYQPEQPESLTKAKDKMYRYLKEMQRYAVLVDKNAGVTGKIKHPHFGYLNALEWYKVTHLHMVHHQKQKNKIDRILRRSPKESFGEDVVQENE
ncbi:MAG: hypothetical protein MUF42_01260 [Cytophagaceae bacterium]|jgi:hypothetical protein|nr:hypothetical protein [Cytophagaceae bacterium]